MYTSWRSNVQPIHQFYMQADNMCQLFKNITFNSARILKLKTEFYFSVPNFQISNDAAINFFKDLTSSSETRTALREMLLLITFGYTTWQSYYPAGRGTLSRPLQIRWWLVRECADMIIPLRHETFCVVTWDIVMWDIVTWDIVTWYIVTWDIVTWDTVTWDIVTWNMQGLLENEKYQQHILNTHYPIATSLLNIDAKIKTGKVLMQPRLLMLKVNK